MLSPQIKEHLSRFYIGTKSRPKSWKKILFGIILSLFTISSARAQDTKIVERYAKNNRIRAKGQLFNGFPTGKWTYWHTNGRKAAEGEYKNGYRNSKWIHWHNNGKKKEEATYIDGDIEGMWLNWHKNGQLKESMKFENYHITGMYSGWHKNGKKDFEIEYKQLYKEDNKIEIINHGRWIYWYKNGQKKQKGIYNNGKLIGKWMYWDKKGNKLPDKTK